MATFSAKRFTGPAFLANTVTSLFTVASGKSAVVKNIVFNNTTTNTISVSVHVVAPSGSTLPTNQIITDLSIGPKSQIIWTADIPLSEAEALYAFASAANSVTATVTGIEIV